MLKTEDSFWELVQPCGFLGLKLGLHASWQVSSPAETSFQSRFYIYLLHCLPWHACRGQRIICRNICFPSTIWVLAIVPRRSDLAASTLTYWVILDAHGTIFPSTSISSQVVAREVLICIIFIKSLMKSDLLRWYWRLCSHPFLFHVVPGLQLFSHPTLKDSFPITTEQPGAESLTSYVRLGPNAFQRQCQSEITKYAFIVNHTPLRKRFLHGRCLSVHFCEFISNTWGRAQGFYSLREHPQWWDWLMPVKWQAFNK